MTSKAAITRIMLSLCLFFAAGGTAGATIGGVAARGDNCTPFNAFAIGYPAAGAEPSPDTIVDHTVILWRGWQVVGWVLTLRDGQLRLIVYRPSGHDDLVLPSGPGSILDLPSMSKADIRSLYERFRASSLTEHSQGAEWFIDPIFPLDPITLSPCFSAPLPKDK